jgi:hypothetical protein
MNKGSINISNINGDQTVTEEVRTERLMEESDHERMTRVKDQARTAMMKEEKGHGQTGGEEAKCRLEEKSS